MTIERRLSARLTTLILMAVLAGCAGVSPRTGPPVSERGAPEAPPAEPPVEVFPYPGEETAPAEDADAAPEQTPSADSQRSSGPVLALLDRADSAAQAGNADSAASSLERALRIEPRNPLIWHRLAVLRLSEGRWAQAEQLALKSLSLIGQDPALSRDNWRVIERARRQNGDTAGADAARRRIQSLQQ